MRTAIAAILVLSLSAAGAHAAVIADFAFDDSSVASSDPSTNWTTSEFANGPSVPLAFDTAIGNPAPSVALTMGDLATNLDGAISDGDYYGFTVSPDAAAAVTFTSFRFDINKISGGADVTGTVFSSIDGFTSADAIGNGVISAQDTWTNFSVDLTGLPTVTTATEFRLYLHTPGTFGPNQIKLDNVIVEGTATPEPATMFLLGVGGLAVIRRRRT